jgi:hypothetical protein
MKLQIGIILLGLVLLGGRGEAATARGVVYEDRNNNQQRDAGEPGLADVGVSNGREVVTTDARGRYELEVDDNTILFVIKPTDYQVPLDHFNLPRFYYVHKPEGSPPGLKYAGVSPTGPLPESVDFPLTRHVEPDEFKVLLLGDPQPNNIGDIDHLANDVVAELIGTDAAFALTLGDIMADLLNLFEPYNHVMSQMGIPVWNTLGNHDINFDVPGDDASDETWERVYGPATYSFNWANVHFIVIDNVYYGGGGEQTGGGYSGHITEKHLQFVKNDLQQVPVNRLVVLAMHIPLTSCNAADLLALLQGRPHTLSLSGHTHDIEHKFLGPDYGWPNTGEHHHLTNGALCGIHWLGAPDEYGIPHAMTHCGSPNGYTIAIFKDNTYSMRFKAPRRPADDQMHVFLPSRLKVTEAAGTEVIVNVYLGSEKNVTEMKIDQGKWVRMEREIREDPYLQKVINPAHPLSQVTHIWVAKLPAGLSAGGHTIHIRTKDMFGQVFTASRIVVLT